MRKLVVGNWKMNGTCADLPVVTEIAALPAACEVALCVPSTLIARAVAVAGPLPIGGQDVHFAPKGAHTGCISAQMLLDAGASLAIVGHSERREAQCETDADIAAKARAGIDAGLRVILCCGESDEVRERGDAIETVSRQLDASLPSADGITGDNLAVAYEPIWAIGTGKIPTLDDIAAMHAALRSRLVAAYGETGSEVRILYGGSVKGSNAADIFRVDHVDGALVGGASLTAEDFGPIIAAA